MGTRPVGPGDHPWRFRLMLATALAVVLIAAVLLRAGIARNEVERRREVLLSVLERLSEAEEDALARDGRYAEHMGPSGGTDTAQFVAPAGIVFVFESLGATAWRAVVRDSTLSAGPRSCGIFRGSPEGSPHRAVVSPGTPACW